MFCHIELNEFQYILKIMNERQIFSISIERVEL